MADARIDLVLLPGLLCDNALWGPQLEALRDVARMRVADLTLHAGIPAMAQAVLAGAPARFAVAGLSMGGRVALEMVRQAPGRISHLALLNTGSGPAAAEEIAPRRALVAQGRAHGIDAIVDSWIAPMIAAERRGDAGLAGAIRAMVGRMTPDIHERQIEALIGRPDASGDLAGIDCPTLILAGEEDRWAPADRHAEMAGRVPGARLAVVPACGHFSTLERPAAVNAALREWLAQAPSPRGGDRDSAGEGGV